MLICIDVSADHCVRSVCRILINNEKKSITSLGQVFSVNFVWFSDNVEQFYRNFTLQEHLFVICLYKVSFSFLISAVPKIVPTFPYLEAQFFILFHKLIPVIYISIHHPVLFHFIGRAF